MEGDKMICVLQMLHACSGWRLCQCRHPSYCIYPDKVQVKLNWCVFTLSYAWLKKSKLNKLIVNKLLKASLINSVNKRITILFNFLCFLYIFLIRCVITLRWVIYLFYLLSSTLGCILRITGATQIKCDLMWFDWTIEISTSVGIYLYTFG